MSNSLLNTVPVLNGSNSMEWLPAIEAYLMSQGLWTTVAEKWPVDSKATVLSRLVWDATQAQRDAVIASIDAATQIAVEDKQKDYDKLNL